MLRKTFKKDTTLLTNIFVGGEDGSSDREFVFSKTLDVESLVNINSIVDFESAEFKPIESKLEIDLFFLRYIEDDEVDSISSYLEEGFTAYHQKVLDATTNIKTSELFEIRSSDNLAAVKFDNEQLLSATEINSEKPYVVIDPMVEIRKKYPRKSGRPHFYNTFTFPFWDKKDLWSELKYGFNNKTYTYSSFLLLEIFDDYNVETQKRITTIPIYVSDRYLFNEKTKDKVYTVLDELLNPINTEVIPGIKQKRPVFNLTEGVDGYSFFFLKNYIKTDFYVKFYFWDALNGKKIQFIPSSKNNVSKKWLQDVENFDQKRLYLKYDLDYAKKSYTIYDFNDRTNNYDLETDHIDLYEFAYDDYWSQVSVLNDQPTDLQVPTNPREYGDLLLSANSIKRDITITDLKHETLSDAIAADPNYIPVEVKFDYTENMTDDYIGQYSIDYYKVSGSTEGYLNFLSNGLNIKPIGLLNTKLNKCVNVNIDSFKRTIGSLRIENKQEVSTYIIDNFNLLDLTFKSNEPTIDLSTYGSLKHNTQTLGDSSLQVEYCVLPKKSITEGYDNYYTTFGTAWSDYAEANKEKSSKDIIIYVTGVTYTSLINNPTHQINFANMIANKSYLQGNDIKNDNNTYTGSDVNSLLLTKPTVKGDGITLIIESLDPKINPKEEIILTIDLVIGAGALYKFGTIKELEITASLEINVYREDIGLDDMKKITVPIKINLK
jgi:hypothetical protein